MNESKKMTISGVEFDLKLTFLIILGTIVPMLAMFYHLPPATTVATSISVVFLNALSGSVAYYQQRRVDLVFGVSYSDDIDKTQRIWFS